MGLDSRKTVPSGFQLNKRNMPDKFHVDKSEGSRTIVNGKENAASVARRLELHELEVCLGSMPFSVSWAKWSELQALGNPAPGVYT
ncbi:hypothetical protein TNCV_4052471 [Trichonephila clavipes]|nr:hypothetical protein TNCV_4052471 [Trichonephila clavipes]